MKYIVTEEFSNGKDGKVHTVGEELEFDGHYVINNEKEIIFSFGSDNFRDRGKLVKKSK